MDKIDFMKSASKIGGFLAFIVCSLFAFYTKEIAALQLGTGALIVLVGTKTAITGAVDVLNKKVKI